MLTATDCCWLMNTLNYHTFTLSHFHTITLLLFHITTYITLSSMGCPLKLKTSGEWAAFTLSHFHAITRLLFHTTTYITLSSIAMSTQTQNKWRVGSPQSPLTSPFGSKLFSALPKSVSPRRACLFSSSNFMVTSVCMACFSSQPH